MGTSLFLQRIETLMNAFLLLSYENAPPNFKNEDLVLNVRSATLYLDTLRRFAAIAGEKDPYNYSGAVLGDFDAHCRREWAELPATQNGERTKLNKEIERQAREKPSRAEFERKFENMKSHSQANEA